MDKEQDAAVTDRPGNRAVPDKRASSGPNVHNIDPENMGKDEDQGLVEDPPSETATPPGPTSK
jgi:hypothetical protein